MSDSLLSAMGLTESQLRDLFFGAVGNLKKDLTESGWTRGRIGSESAQLFDKWDLAEYLYAPDAALVSRISDYNRWRELKEAKDPGHKEENPGHLMEEIALLAFRCLKGWESVRSYQSYGPQHDLVISGSEGPWVLLMVYLHLPPTGRTIVVEAKNPSRTVSDQQFSRLCSIIQNKFIATCHLGVFITRKGAAGFSNRRSLRDARATQALFHAKTEKFVIVLDNQDLQQLTREGGLPRVLESKIRDVENASSVPSEVDDAWKSIELPPHLARHNT